ncbi:MAG TPA: diacylglycerol kinase family protein [Pyrinomonadaceae bacterium]
MNHAPPLLVIINQVAARARRAWPGIRRALNDGGVAFDAHETTHAGDATERTRAALREGYRLIAVVGGDGTLSEAAAGFFEQPPDERGALPERVPAPVRAEAALALLPAGTGDDFARGWTGGRAPLEAWLKALVAHYHWLDAGDGSGEASGSERDAGPTGGDAGLIGVGAGPTGGGARAVDVIYGSPAETRKNFICLNVATLGLGAQVAARVASQRGLVRRLPGEARFVQAACGALAAWRERSVRVTLDHRTVLEGRSNMIAIANGIYAGGGMMFAPAALTGDGRLDFLMATGVSRATILREMPRIRRGAHLSNPHISTRTAAHVRIETGTAQDEALLIEADGNVRGYTPAEFQVMPGALRFVGPHRPERLCPGESAAPTSKTARRRT